MKKHHHLFIICATFFAVSCTSTQKGAVTGAVGGAALGTLIADGENHKKGALYGAGIGAVSGAVVGKNLERKRVEQGSPYYY